MEFHFRSRKEPNSSSFLSLVHSMITVSQWLTIRKVPGLIPTLTFLCGFFLQVFQVLPLCPKTCTLGNVGLSAQHRDDLYAALSSARDDGSKLHLELEQRLKWNGWINVCITASLHHHHQRVDEWTANGNFFTAGRLKADGGTLNLQPSPSFTVQVHIPAVPLWQPCQKRSYLYGHIILPDNTGNISVAHIWWRSCTITTEGNSVLRWPQMREATLNQKQEFPAACLMVLMRRKRKWALDRCTDTHVQSGNIWSVTGTMWADLQGEMEISVNPAAVILRRNGILSILSAAFLAPSGFCLSFGWGQLF